MKGLDSLLSHAQHQERHDVYIENIKKKYSGPHTLLYPLEYTRLEYNETIEKQLESNLISGIVSKEKLATMRRIETLMGVVLYVLTILNSKQREIIICNVKVSHEEMLSLIHI